MGATTVNIENDGFLLDDFLKSLEGKGFSIDIDDYVVATQISTLHFSKGLVDETKYSLAAIICRNAEEQQKFYQLFEDYIEKSKKVIDGGGNWIQPEKPNLLASIAIDIVLLIASFLYFVPIAKTDQYVGEKKPIETSGHFTTDNAVSFSILKEPVSGSSNKKWDSKQTLYQHQFTPSYDTTGLNVEWHLQDTIIKDKKSIQYRFKSPGKKNIAIHFLYGNTIKRIHNDTIFICEPPPQITVPDEVYVNEKTIFTAASAEDKPLIWTLDGSDTITKSNVLEQTFTERGNHTISCKTQGQLCLHDSESKALNTKRFEVADKEEFTVNKTPDKLYTPPYSNSLTPFFYWFMGIASLFLLCCLLTLFVPYIYSLYEKIIRNYFNAANRKKAEKYFKDSTEPIFTGDKPPIDIRFYNKDRLIKSKQNIRKLGFDLKRKVATEDSKINLMHTIKASIRNFDLLTPVYVNKDTKRSYLFLIDVSNPKNSQVKLFAFLINHLKKSQVNLDVYYYFRDPIRVFKREVDDSINIKTLKDKYYQSVLIVFSNGYNFLDANSPEIQATIRKEYSYWTNRILVTPMPSLDWSVNEKILASFFHIVAADSSGLLSIFPMLEKGSYDQKVVNTKDFNTYESKFIEFEDIIGLKAFLVNNEMFQWLCAIAVYPKITWEVILTIGETINPSLVTYENLLRLSRIEWIQNGSFPTRIRLELLKNLDRDYEIASRKAIIKLLEEESKKDDSTFSNNERIIQLIFNKFILYSYDSKTFALYEKEEKEFLRLYQNEKFKDIPLKVYLQGVDPDKKDKWESLMKESSEKGIDNLAYYYNTKTNATPLQLISKSIKKYLRAASLFFFIIVSALAFIGFTKPTVDLFAHRQELIPADWNIKLNIDECYRAFNPAKLIISDNGKIIYNGNITEKDSIIPLKSIFKKDLSLQFISYKNDTISTNITVQQPNSIVGISGLYCNRIKAEFYGRDYERYKEVLETEQLQTTNIRAADKTNCLIFTPSVDSSFVYKLCLDLIKKKFPLQEITMDTNFSPDEIKSDDTKILFEQRKSDKKIIETEEELNCRFYGCPKYPEIMICYFPKSNYAQAKKLEQAIIKSGFKFSKITFNTHPSGQVSMLNEDGIAVFQKDFQKNADMLAKIATQALQRKIISEKFAGYNPYSDPFVLEATIIDWSVLIYKTNQFDKILKYFEGSSMKMTIVKDSERSQDINCIYYSGKTTKQEAVEFAKDVIKNSISIKAVLYKRNLKENVELGYDKQYDKCEVLTEDDLNNDELGCKEKTCESGIMDAYKYVIYFEKDKWNIPADGMIFLDKILDQLRKYPDFTATISSYSNEGNDKYSMSQSEQRARSSADWLIKNGIDSQRIRSVGMGNTGYKNQNCFDRSEIVLEAEEKNASSGNPNETNADLINVPSGSNYTIKGKYLYYGNYGGGKWTERYFKNKNGTSGLPKVGDEIISTSTVNVREQVIQYVDGEWVNQKSVGVLKTNTTVMVTKVITVAGGNFVWVEYEPVKSTIPNNSKRVPIRDSGKQ